MTTIGILILCVGIFALFGWIFVKGMVFIWNTIISFFKFLTGSWFRIIILTMIIGILLVKLSGGI